MSIVTAVIPCYNAASHLESAIASVRAQSLPVDTILVIDDGSTDASRHLAERAGVTLLETGGQRGPGAARNMGIRHAATPLIAFLDADDIWLPHHCATLVDLLDRHPEAGAAFGRIQRFDHRGDVPTPRYGGIRREGTLPELLADNPIAQSAAVARRAALDAVGGFREDIRHAEDYDLWLRMAERWPIVPTDLVTCRYRLHPAQATSSLAAMTRGTWSVRLSACDRLRAAGSYGPEHDALLERALDDDIRTAWVVADATSLEALIGIAAGLPGGAGRVPGIRRKIRLAPLKRVALGWRSLIRGGP